MWTDRFPDMDSFSSEPVRCEFPDHFFDGKALQKKGKCLLRELSGFLLMARPLEMSDRDPLVEKKDPVALIDKAFDPVGPSPAEQVQCVFLERIPSQVFPDDSGQSVDSQPEIGVTSPDINMLEAVGFLKHDAPPPEQKKSVPGEQAPRC